jgi:Fe2+ transport system protein B
MSDDISVPASNPDKAEEDNKQQQQAKEKSKSITQKITDTVTTSNSLPAASESEKISANARVVILGLFTLVGFLVLLFAITAMRTPAPLTDVMVQVFTAAITGSFTLGGVLITQLWGK